MTEQTLPEAALRFREGLFRTVFEAAAFGIALGDAEGRLLETNRSLQQMLGYTSEELQGMSPAEFTHPDDLLADVSLFQELVGGSRDHYQLEKRLIRKNGQVLWGRVTVSLAHEAQSGGPLIIGMLEDITERKQVEMALRETEVRFRALADTAPALIWMSGLDGLCYYFNQRWLEFTGRTLEEELGNGWFEGIHPDDLDRCLDAYLTAFNARESFRMEYRLRRAGGEYGWLLDTGTPRYTPDGEFAGFIGACIDITESRRTKEDLERSEERFRLLVQNSSDIITVFSAEGVVLYQSPSLKPVLGYEPAERIGTNIFESLIVHPDDLAQKRWFLHEAIAHPNVDVTAEFRLQHANGNYRIIEVSGRNLLHEPLVGGIVANMRDITERKGVEEELRRSLGALLALHESGQMLGSSLEMEETSQRLLEIVRRVCSLSAGVISVQDRYGQLAVRTTTGPEEVWTWAGATSAAEAARLAALESGEPQTFPLRPPGEAIRLVGWCLPLRAGGRTMGLLEVYGPQSLDDKDTAELLNSLAAQAATALENARLYQELLEREDQLAALVGELIVAHEEERCRLAYDVHDGLAQTAVATYQHLQVFAESRRPRSSRARAELHRVVALARQTVVEARQVIADLRPTVLDDFGLAVAIQQQVESLQDEGWQIIYDEALGGTRLPASLETALFRIVQEALTNVRKHAHSKRVDIALTRGRQCVQLEVRDYGEGFQTSARPARGGPGERVGLSSMRERVASVGGRFEIGSAKGGGTRLSVEIPLLGSVERGRDLGNKDGHNDAAQDGEGADC